MAGIDTLPHLFTLAFALFLCFLTLANDGMYFTKQ